MLPSSETTSADFRHAGVTWVHRPMKLQLLPLLLLFVTGVGTILPGSTSSTIFATAVKAPIVISGAGPAGLIFAHRFLRCNHDTPIHIYEKRGRPLRYVEDTHHECVAGDYAFGFGISKKSQQVLNRTQGLLEAVEAISQPSAFAPGIDIRLVNRRELCAELLFELEREFGDSDRLKVVFDTEIADLDDTDKDCMAVTTITSSNITGRTEYSLLIAADGANSKIRSKLIEDGYLTCERYYSDGTWKALQLPEQPNLDASGFYRYPKPFHRPHRSITKDRGAILPRFQNRHVLLNFRARENSDSPHHVFNATTPQELREAIRVILPNITNFPSDDVLQAFIDQKPGRESYMKLDRHYVPERNVVLVGDAAVGMYSLFGQGAANAMLHADDLAETLCVAAANVGVDAALQQYSEKAVVEGHAIADLNLLSHALRRKGLIKIWAGFQMMGIGRTLAKAPEVPYSAILKKWKRAIWLSKYFWRRDRLETTIVPLNPKSKK